MFHSPRMCAPPLLVMLAALPASATGQTPATPTNVTVTATSQTPVQGKQWTINDDGHFVTAENSVLRLKFAYNAANYQGWFVGTGSGGGGRDGGIVELYYKPTSPTRNLIFRNGTWGSGYDNMDFWEAEAQGGTQSNFNAPDYESGRHAVMNGHSISESAGRLIATFDFQFQAWHIVRTYTVYPWGDITVSAQLTVTQSSQLELPGAQVLLRRQPGTPSPTAVPITGAATTATTGSPCTRGPMARRAGTSVRTSTSTASPSRPVSTRTPSSTTSAATISTGNPD